jgi:hypothetical protein
MSCVSCVDAGSPSQRLAEQLLRLQEVDENECARDFGLEGDSESEEGASDEEDAKRQSEAESEVASKDGGVLSDTESEEEVEPEAEADEHELSTSASDSDSEDDSSDEDRGNPLHARKAAATERATALQASVFAPSAQASDTSSASPLVLEQAPTNPIPAFALQPATVARALEPPSSVASAAVLPPPEAPRPPQSTVSDVRGMPSHRATVSPVLPSAAQSSLAEGTAPGPLLECSSSHLAFLHVQM